MFNKPFDNINIDDINFLIENAVPEGTSIDYKEQLHLDSREQRKEFAADVTSFANTNGGYLVFGVSENEGVINEINGEVFSNIDHLKQKIENLLRDMVEPRMNGLQMKAIEINAEKSIFIIRIQRSFSGPHIVRGREFYGRNTSGKYQLEYNEIKRRFLENEGLYKEIQDFHLERLFKVKADEGYLRLAPGPTIMLNVLPLSAFGFDASVLDLGSPYDEDFAPLYQAGVDYHIGFEGIGWRTTIQHQCYGYHHINRRGIVEIVDRGILRIIGEGQRITINIPMIEQKLNEVANKIARNYLRYGVEGPFVLRFALLDVGQAVFINQNGEVTQYNILQNDLLFPSMIINDFSEFRSFSSQVGDLLYNAAGYTQRPTHNMQ
jgi:hypothetical protein